MAVCEVCGKTVDDIEIYDVNGVKKCPQCALNIAPLSKNDIEEAVRTDVENNKKENAKESKDEETDFKGMQSNIDFADKILNIVFVILIIASIVGCVFLGPLGILVFIALAFVLFVIYNFGAVFLEMAQNVLEIRKQTENKNEIDDFKTEESVSQE